MKAIGIKMVEYQPMTKGEAKEKGYFRSTDDQDLISKDEGYVVIYPDGYKSWSPKTVFDEAYFKLFDDAGEAISPNDIENIIVDKYSVKVGTKNTNTTLVCKTGFEVHGQSGVVKAENFDLSIGERYAEPKAKDQLWFVMGFILQWAKYGLNKVIKDYTPSHAKKVIIEEKELTTKINALEDFISHSNAFQTLYKFEQDAIYRQLIIMKDYRAILRQRLEYINKN